MKSYIRLPADARKVEELKRMEIIMEEKQELEQSVELLEFELLDLDLLEFDLLQ